MKGLLAKPNITTGRVNPANNKYFDVLTLLRWSFDQLHTDSHRWGVHCILRTSWSQQAHHSNTLQASIRHLSAVSAGISFLMRLCSCAAARRSTCWKPGLAYCSKRRRMTASRILQHWQRCNTKQGRYGVHVQAPPSSVAALRIGSYPAGKHRSPSVLQMQQQCACSWSYNSWWCLGLEHRDDSNVLVAGLLCTIAWWRWQRQSVNSPQTLPGGP